MNLASYRLGFNFTTPLSLFNLFRKSDIEDEIDCDEGAPHENAPPSSRPHVEDSQLEIYASVGGKLQHLAEMVTFLNEDTGEDETQTVCHPLLARLRVLTFARLSYHLQ